MYQIEDRVQQRNQMKHDKIKCSVQTTLVRKTK